MTTKHTPGPWCRGEFPKASVGTSDGWAVASVNTLRHEYDANVRLITAAPDLLEACKVASALLKGAPRSLGYDFDAKQLDAAIAKAEGV